MQCVRSPYYSTGLGYYLVKKKRTTEDKGEHEMDKGKMAAERQAGMALEAAIRQERALDLQIALIEQYQAEEDAKSAALSPKKYLPYVIVGGALLLATAILWE